ncbi:MAG: guanylate kinase [Legionellales bacterium]|nr:guanylate kinase [Legionellales bacterium]
MTGQLFVISAPSGAGKTSLVTALTERNHHMTVSISYTTRPQREGEENGVHYYFVDKSTFTQMIEDNCFLEHAQVFNHYYGTGQHWVEKRLREDQDVILEIDWQGAEQIRRLLPKAIGIFILPPSLHTLEERLQRRAQDSHAVIKQRIAQAQAEIAHCYEYDYVVVNDCFEDALADLQAIVRARRLKIGYQRLHLASLINKLMTKQD